MAVSLSVSGWLAGRYGSRRAFMLTLVSPAAFWTLRTQDGESVSKGSAALA